ncbi:MAG: GntR family transcriptional regulator [Solirubrobacterales bacterium]
MPAATKRSRATTWGEAEELANLQLRAPDGISGELSAQVYRELREAICDCRIPPRQRLVQNALADQLGISRTPVRDALSRLVQEGLVDPAPVRGGFIVREFTPHAVLEIYDVRLSLEPVAARGAAGHHTGAQIAEMRDINAAIGSVSSGSLSEKYELNERFHSLVVEPYSNEIMKRMLAQLWQMPSALRMYHLQASEEEHDVTVSEHREIIDALESGNATAVVKRIEAHILGAKQIALEHFEADGQ